jgi:cytochrome c-type biogenesis protein CcmH
VIRRLRPAALIAVAALALSLPIATRAATTPRASLTDIESDVMCVSCKEPLAVAQSPQSYAERNYIRTLIAQGKTKREIEQALVGQYGPAVLGKPPADGFNLTVYVLPPAIVLLGVATLAVTLPRWRRRTRQGGVTPVAAGPRLSSLEAKRLDEDLARFDG